MSFLTMDDILLKPAKALAEILTLRNLVTELEKKLASTVTDRDRISRNREMWREQCKHQAANLTAMREHLRNMVDEFRPFMSMPVGAPNSPARLDQDHKIAVYRAARAFLVPEAGGNE